MNLRPGLPVLGAIAVIAIAACGRVPDEPATEPAAHPPTNTGSPAAAPRKPVDVAWVDGAAITTADLDAAIEEIPALEDRLEYAAPAPVRELLEQLIDQRLMAERARASGLAATEPVAAALDRLGPEPGRALTDRVLAEAFIDQRLAGLGPVGPGTLRRYYDEHADEFGLPARARVTRLVFGTEAGAQAARSTLGKNRDFAALLAAEPAGLVRQDEIWLQRQAAGSPLQDAVFALQAGQTSGVIPVAAGWCLVHVEEIQTAGRRAFADVELDVRARVAAERRSEVRASVRGELRNGASIRVDEAALAQYHWKPHPDMAVTR